MEAKDWKEGRRGFLKSGLLVALSVILTPLTRVFGEGGATGPVSENEPLAVSFGYVKDAKKADDSIALLPPGIAVR